MADLEKVITHLDDLRLFTDIDVHPVVSPENWGIYSTLCDYIDQIKEEVETLLKEQEIIGHWEEPEDEGIVSFNPAAYVQCSVCKQKACFGHKDRFCRHCGARMEVKEEAP